MLSVNAFGLFLALLEPYTHVYFLASRLLGHSPARRIFFPFPQF